MNINYIFLYLTTFFIFIYFLFKKYKILQENISYSEHKKLGKSNKSPILIGGVFIVISLLILLPKNLIFFKIASILIFLVGVLSDKNIISSPKLRLFFQVSIIFFLVYFEKLYIIGVNIHFIDYLLNINYFNYFFTIFCFAVLVNGSNFLDGLNGLLSGYFILVLISTFYVSNYQINVNNDIKDQINLFLIITIIFYIFNLFGIVYLGDSGSYLLSISVGFILIKIHQDTNFVSPYYIANMLWYPAFENLFSLLRRFLNKNKISSADKLHLHQLIFRFLRSKTTIKDDRINTLSGFILILLNIPSIYFATSFYYHSIILISIIFYNLIMYLLIYYFLSKNFKLKK